MDAERFDHLTRTLGDALPRRRALPLFTGGALGLLLGRPAHGQTLGKRRCGKKRCKKVHVCYKKRCRPIPVAGKRCYSGLPCRNGAVCATTGGGLDVCVCPGGTTACGAFPETECVNLRTDPFHCGSCLNRCLAGITTCCAVGPLEPGECVDTQTDERHCGGCGRACAAGETCLGGSCQSRCRAGFALCGEQCVDLQTNSAHCGACDNRCAAGQGCAGGRCGSCQAGLTACGGACVDLQADPVNCGSCGRSCPVGSQCQNGVCVGTRCKDDGQTCQTHTDCCRYPESTCNDGVCVHGCSLYGGPCSSQSDCCETGPGTRPPCSGGLCRFN